MTQFALPCHVGTMKKLLVVFLAFLVLLPALSFLSCATSRYFDLGLESYNAGDLDMAIANWTEVIRLNPKSIAAYRNRGVAYRDKEQWDQCIEDWNEVLRLNPDYPNVKTGLAEAYLKRGIAHVNKEQWDQCIEDWEQVLRLDPEYAEATQIKISLASVYYNRGFVTGTNGNLDGAIADFDRTIELDPFHVQAYSGRGLAHGTKKQWEQCIADLNEVLKLDPEYAEENKVTVNLAISYLNRGIANSNDENYDIAIADFDRAIELNPFFAEAMGERGFAYLSKGEYDKAIEDCNQAIFLDPDLAMAWNIRGATYANKREYDKAIEDCNQAIFLDHDLADAWNNRGYAYLQKGELDRAIEDFSKAIALDPDLAGAWNNRGYAYLIKGEYDRAIEDFSKAIAINPNDVDAWSNRGGAYLSKGDPDRAIEDFSKAIALNPNYVGAWSNRGTADRLKGDLDRAIEDCNQAIFLDPDFANAWSSRGDAYRLKGDLDRAIEDYNKAIALDPNDGMLLGDRGDIYFVGKGDFARALEDYRQATAVADKSGNILDIFFCSWRSANRLHSLLENNPFRRSSSYTVTDVIILQFANLARGALERSIARVEQARFSLGSRGAEIMTALIYQYYAAVDIEAVFDSWDRAFAYSEGLRSRGFLEQMGTEQALSLPGIDAEDAENLQQLIAEIGNLQNLRSNLDPQKEAGSYSAAGIALTMAEEALTALDSKIAADVFSATGNDRYTELRHPKPKSLADAQAFCGDDRAILEYVLWDSSVEFKTPSTLSRIGTFDRPSINSYCFVITKDSITQVKLDPDFDYVGKVNELRHLITSRASVDEMEPARNALYAALIKPVVSCIPSNVSNLLIVPDGTLGHLPFDLLRENESSTDLGTAYRLSFSPSVSVSILAAQSGIDAYEPLIAMGGAWYNANKTAADRGEANLFYRDADFGNPTEPDVYSALPTAPVWKDLPGTEAEVQNIRQLVSSRDRAFVLLGKDVSEEQIKNMSLNGELIRYPVIHFACHGYFDEADASRSGIVLSEVSGLLENEEDGYLTIPEIAILNMKARMVMLSACETGKAELKRGDGMVGMARAFLVAGTQNVGVSLWSISDAGTMEFMTRLYGKVLKENLPFREAYYRTKQEFRASSTWNHPYYWAAFTMYE